MKENLFEAYARMCNSFESCENGCPMYQCNWGYLYRDSCQQFVVENAKKAEEIVTKWAEEHPIKTRQYVFLELHPNAALDDWGVLKVNTCAIDNRISCEGFKFCAECRKEYWGEVVK